MTRRNAIRVLQDFAARADSRRLIIESACAFVCLSESGFNFLGLRLPSAQLAVSPGLVSPGQNDV